MCTVHGAALTVGKIKQYEGGSPPSAGQTVAQEEEAYGAAPTCNELGSCALPSPSLGNTAGFRAAGGERAKASSSAQSHGCPTTSSPAFPHLLFRRSLAARLARVLLLSKNKEVNMAQRPSASHKVLHYGLRPLSHLSQIFKDCRNAGTSGERPAQPLLPIAALFLQRNGH